MIMNQSVRILLISMALSTLLGLPIFGAANDFCSSESTRPNLLFLLDNSGSMMTSIIEANGNPTDQKRIDALKEALLTMLENTHNVNVGLGRFAALIEKKPEPPVGVNVPIMFPVSYIDGMANEIPGEIDDTIMDVSVSIAQSADDAEQNVGTGKMSLADAKLQLVTTTAEEPNGIKVEKPIADDGDDGVEWLGDFKKNWFSTGGQILYLGTDPESEVIRNKGDSLIGLRFEKFGIPKGATIEFAEIEFVSDQEYDGELQINIYGAANDGVKPTINTTGDPSGIALGSSNFKNDAGNKYGYLSGEGYSTENFPKQNLTVWDLPPKVVANEVFNTPDISGIIQAIVERDGWLDDNGLVLLFERNSNSPVNTRGFYSYDGRAIGEPPLLRVYWSLQNATATAVSGVEADGSIFKSDHAAETKNTDKYSTKEIRLGKQRDTNLLGNGDETLVGIRFQNINIPKGSIISEANITFTHQSGSEQDEWGNKPLNLMVFGEKSADADYFGNSSIRPERKVSARPKTDAYVEWEEVENTDVGQQFGIIPNSSGGTISDILQEIIEQTDWRKGNDVVFLLERNGDTNTGFRRIVGTGDNYVKDGVISRWYDEATVDPNELVPFNPAEPDGEKIHKNLPRLEVTFSVGLPSDNVGPAENDKQIVGLRFEKVDIPNGAEIVSAHIEFTSGADAAEPTILVIKAEDVDDAKSFTDKPNNISERSTTSNQVYWNQEPWENGLTYQSPDISAVVQEVVDRDGWCGGRGGLAFIISGSSEEPLRVAKSYDNRPTEAPVLKVKFDSKKINGNGCVNQNFSGQIQAKSDDAEQKLSGGEAGNIYLTSDTLELASRGGSETRLVGFRFREIPISSTARVLSAHLVLNARTDKKGIASFNIYGEKSPNPDTFANDTSNLSKRPKTSARVTWSLEDAWESNQIYKSPNISSVIQEIIKQGDWETYNNMVLFIDGMGQRNVSSFEASPLASAILQIQVEGYLGEGGEGDLMTVRRRLKKIVRKMEIPNSWTPIVDALYEATQYYQGEAVEFGKSRHDEYLYLISHPGTIYDYKEGMISRAEECKININPLAEVCASEEYTVPVVNYASPIKSSCQTNHIVLLTDGVATRHTSLELVQSLIGNSECMSEYPDPDDPEGGETIKVSKYEMCGIDLADFLVENDHVNKEPGTKNTVTLHTIGFQLGKAWRTIYVDASNNKRVYRIDGINYYDEARTEPVPEGTKLKKGGYEENVKGTATNARAVKYLKRLASLNEDNGKRNFYPADTVEDLEVAFNNIISVATTTSTSFAAPGVSINLLNKLQHNNDVYYALFKPSKNQSWDGNLKKFQIKGGMLIGQDDKIPAIIDGEISSSVKSIWSKELEEGKVVKGGAGEQLQDIGSSSRVIYTHLGDASPGTNHNLDLTKLEVSSVSDEFDTALSKKLFGDDISSVTEEQRDNLIRGILGENVNPAEGESSGDRWMFADPLHSSPKVVTYGIRPNTKDIADTRLFVGTNDGLLRMIDDIDGREVWAFLPQEMLSIQSSLMENKSGEKRIYGLDSTPTIWRNDRDDQINPDDGDFVKLFIGMRRGGRNLYAIDVTGETRDRPGVPPKLMWTIKGGEGSYTQLGETWSAPKTAVVDPRYCGTRKCVALLFGGGYDDSQDDGVNPDDVRYGNAIYMVNAWSGELLWWASSNSTEANLKLDGMDYPIPSDLAFLDTSGDGYNDRIYVGDIGGQVWRIDLEFENEKGAALANFTGGSNKKDKRSFFYPPAMVHLGGKDVVTTVSGRRTNPLSKGHQEHNQFFAFLDYGWEADESGDVKAPEIITQSDMIQVDIISESANKTKVNLLELKDKKKGWYLNLNLKEDGEGNFTSGWNGEKGLSSPVIMDSKVFFTTYIPPDDRQVACEKFDYGESRLYMLDLLSGDSIVDGKPFNNAGKGIVTSPVLMFVNDEIDDKQAVPPNEDGATIRNAGDFGEVYVNRKPVRRTFWMQNSAPNAGNFECSPPPVVVAE